MESGTDIKPARPFYKKILRFFGWVISLLAILSGTAVTLVMLYEDDVKAMAISELNKHLRSEVRIDPKDIDLTFISSFPKCAIEFKNLTAMEAVKKKERDTLLHAGSIKLKFNIRDLFNRRYVIRQISIHDGGCFLKVEKNGETNFQVWDAGEKDAKGNDSLQFKLKDIHVENFRVRYKDRQQKWKTDVTITDLVFSGDFSESEYQLSTTGKLVAHELVSGKTELLRNKHIQMDLSLQVKNNLYKFTDARVKVNQMNFDMNGQLLFADSLHQLSLHFNGSDLDIASVLSLLPETYRSRMNDYESSGEFFAKGDINYHPGKPLSLHTSFGIKDAGIVYKPGNAQLKRVKLKGELAIDEKQQFIHLSEIQASLNGDEFNGTFHLSDFKNPYVDLTADGHFDLQQVNAFWPMDTIEHLEGKLKFTGALKAPVSELKNHLTPEVHLSLAAELQQLKIKFKKDEKQLGIESCIIKAEERDIKVENLKMMKGKSDITLSGEMPGVFNFILDSKAPLVIKGQMSSNYIDMEDLIYSSGNGDSSELKIPANVRLLLDVDVKQFVFNKLSASDIKGNFELKDQRAMLSDMHLNAMDGSAEIDALADASGKTVDFSLQSKLTNINVSKMFSQLNNFGQSTLMDKHLKGFLTASVVFSGSWDKKLNADLASIQSSAELLIQRGELNEFKPLEKLSKFVELEDLRHIRFASLASNVRISNQTIHIPQTTIKNSALNIDFSGKHDFNNNIDYHIRLLISELLSKKRKKQNDEFGPVENDPDNRRCAFVLMTGNVDDIDIRYDRQGMKQKINEDIKKEKENLKAILKEEFGWFRKDSLKKTSSAKADQKFELEKTGNNPPKKTLEPKKKEEDDDDF